MRSSDDAWRNSANEVWIEAGDGCYDLAENVLSTALQAPAHVELRTCDGFEKDEASDSKDHEKPANEGGRRLVLGLDLAGESKLQKHSKYHVEKR